MEARPVLFACGTEGKALGHWKQGDISCVVTRTTLQLNNRPGKASTLLDNFNTYTGAQVLLLHLNTVTGKFH